LGELPQHPDYCRLYHLIDSEIDSRTEQLLSRACTDKMSEINELGGELKCLRAFKARLVQIEEASRG
jgi:hypothetical protein